MEVSKPPGLHIQEASSSLNNTVSPFAQNNHFLKVGCHNINGLKSNSFKSVIISEWALEENLDIIGIAETNISSKEGVFLDFNRDNFVGFWSNTEKEKKKGSGVGLLIHKKWERHLGQVKKDSPYYLEATFLFKQLELIIIMVYIPPNNKEITRAVQQSIVKKVAQGSQRNQYIIMGDFNYVPDQTLNRKCPRS